MTWKYIPLTWCYKKLKQSGIKTFPDTKIRTFLRMQSGTADMNRTPREFPGTGVHLNNPDFYSLGFDGGKFTPLITAQSVFLRSSGMYEPAIRFGLFRLIFFTKGFDC